MQHFKFTCPVLLRQNESKSSFQEESGARLSVELTKSHINANAVHPVHFPAQNRTMLLTDIVMKAIMLLPAYGILE